MGSYEVYEHAGHMRGYVPELLCGRSLLVKVHFVTCIDHALNAAAPLLNETEFMKDTAYNAIPLFRNATANFFQGKARRQAAGIVDFYPIVKDGNAQRSSLLGMVRMDQRVDNCLA